jgi:hypothetical protein
MWPVCNQLKAKLEWAWPTCDMPSLSHPLLCGRRCVYARVCVCVSCGRWFVSRCARRSRRRAGGSRFAALHRGPQDLCPTSAASPRATRQPTLVFGSTTASLRSMMLTFARCRTCIHPPITSFHPSINPRVSLPLHENASSRPPLRHTQPVMTTTDLSQCGALSLVLATVTCSLFERPPSHRANLAHDTHTHTHTHSHCSLRYREVQSVLKDLPPKTPVPVLVAREPGFASLAASLPPPAAGQKKPRVVQAIEAANGRLPAECVGPAISHLFNAHFSCMGSAAWLGVIHVVCPPIRFLLNA